MTETTDLRSWIVENFKAAGLRGRGSIWRLRGEDVQWVAHIDELPYGKRLAVDVGLDLQSDTTRRLPTDCPVLIHLENLPFAARFEVIASLDLNFGMAPDRRREEVRGVASALADYMANRVTMSDVRGAYENGDFSSAFVRKDARAVLGAGTRS